MSSKKIKPFWPELPCGRFEIDHVSGLLREWALLAEITATGKDRERLPSLFQNSVLHVLECALLPWLANYTYKQGSDSESIRDLGNLDHSFASRIFKPGYPLEMAEALSICYCLDNPFDLTIDDALGYVDELVYLIKDIALYEVESSSYWEGAFQSEKIKGENSRRVAEKFTKGRRPGALSPLKNFVFNAIREGDLSKSAKLLWKVLLAVAPTFDRSDGFPLYREDDDLYETGYIEKKYMFERFEKHVSELKKTYFKNSG